jgi:hypothetical protein
MMYSHIVRYSSSKTTFTGFIKNKLFGIIAFLSQVWEEVHIDFGVR